VASHDEPILVTTAGVSPGDERRARERRYLITMAVRVVAFIVAIVFATGWIRVIAVILALVLPWIGVVMANAPKRKTHEAPSLYTAERPRELE
jgi:Flp pilus assembly protein TadB